MYFFPQWLGSCFFCKNSKVCVLSMTDLGLFDQFVLHSDSECFVCPAVSLEPLLPASNLASNRWGPLFLPGSYWEVWWSHALWCESFQANRSFSLPARPGSESFVFSWDRLKSSELPGKLNVNLTDTDVHGTSSSMSLVALVLQIPIIPLPLGQLRWYNSPNQDTNCGPLIAAFDSSQGWLPSRLSWPFLSSFQPREPRLTYMSPADTHSYIWLKIIKVKLLKVKGKLIFLSWWFSVRNGARVRFPREVPGRQLAWAQALCMLPLSCLAGLDSLLPSIPFGS